MASMHNSGAWSYAVPLEETDGNVHPYPQPIDSTPGTDDRPLQKRSSAWDLMSDSETAKQRRTSLRNNNASQQAVKKRSRNQLRDRRHEEKKGERVDDSAWIHRDKLAQIEIKEMEEAGIYIGKSSRSASAGPAHEDEQGSRSLSRSGLRSPPSRSALDLQDDNVPQDGSDIASYSNHDASPRKRISTIPSAPEEDFETEPHLEHQPEISTAPELVRPPLPDYDPYQESSYHSFGSSGADQQLSRQHTRPGTSRIPVSRVSPVPVPQNVIDRDLPLPRSRAGSQNQNGSIDDTQYTWKGRSPSMSSQVVLESDADPTHRSPPRGFNKSSSNDERSQSKPRMPVKTGRPSGATAATQRPGSSQGQSGRSSSASASRPPGSSSGHRARPSGHTSPEGEAPWIATMYKPDPRLPPDQQMLPTHAKRMMQEQWERDGKAGTVYDRDFRLLNNDAPPPKLQTPDLALDNTPFEPPPRSPSPSKKERNSPHSPSPTPWPISPAKSDRRSESNGRPGTSGGYKITPTIPQTPTMQRLPTSAAPLPNVTTQNPTPRIPELDEKQETAPKKGCCCVMM